MANFSQVIAADDAAPFDFKNTYAGLPERFFVRLNPTPVRSPQLIRLNNGLAKHLGIDPNQLQTMQGVEILSGNRIPAGAAPLAMAYAGHQFGSWVPQLGDGRAILLGEVIGQDGVRRDIQLKGAGRTPFSRMGDGRAVLGPVLREYIVSEAMYSLGVPTTRALAAVTTGEKVMRERPFPGAIFARVAQSHVRVGTFQFFAARKDTEAVRFLADYVIARHFPDTESGSQPYLGLLRAVVSQQAKLVARWQLVGFIHRVMNTDNTSIAGETIDYGPCAFMDSYHPETVYSSIDQTGRYAYSNQPGIAYWNLGCFAQTLLPLFDKDVDMAVSQAEEIIGAYPSLFEKAYLSGLRSKIGLLKENEEDQELAQDLLDRMTENEADYTLTFRRLCDLVGSRPEADEPVRSLFKNPADFDDWVLRWRKRVAKEQVNDVRRQEAMRGVNPAYIPRNHLVEEAINAAINEEDFSQFDKLITVLSSPYDDQPDFAKYAAPPRPDQVICATYCGT